MQWAKGKDKENKKGKYN